MRITMSIGCPFTPNLAKPRNSGWSAAPGLLRGILASEQEYRHNFIPGVFENHLDQMIAAEKRSVTHFLKEAAANASRPAPNKKTKEQPQR